MNYLVKMEEESVQRKLGAKGRKFKSCSFEKKKKNQTDRQTKTK